MPLDFPSSPTNGQQYQGYVYDATRQVWSHFDYLSGTSLLGTIYAWPLDDIPAWALELNGQAVSRTTYSGLFALLGTTYGAGDGSTTFNLPDYRGRTLVGENSGTFANVGTNVGSETTSIPNHTHQHISPVGLISGAAAPISPADDDLQAIGSYGLNGIVTAPRGTVSTASGSVERYTVTSSAAGAATPNIIQPSTVVKWIICATTSTGDFNTEVQTALVTRVSDTPLSQNFILNGAFDVWQRGTSVTPTSTVTYSADRWESFRTSYVAGMRVTRQTSGVPTGFEYYARVERLKDNTGTEGIFFCQPIESQDSVFLVGKEVTLSFYARRGADLSSASQTISATVFSGTGIDENRRGGITGSATVATSSVALTTSFARYSITGTVGATANQIFVLFNYTPTGTAGDSDRFDITGIQLELGDTPTPFRRANPTLQAELAACQRYYEVSVSSGASQQYVGTGVAYTASSVYAMLPFKVEKRIVPEAVISNGTNFWGFDRAGAMDQFSTLQAATSPQTTRQLGVVFASAELAGTAGQSGILLTQNAGASLAWNAEL